MSDSTRECTAPLYSELGSDPDLGEIVEMFVDEMPERVAELIALYDGSDQEELTRRAHQLKGAAGGYGFPEISRKAAVLEERLRNTQPEDEIRLALNEVIDLCNRARSGAPD